MELEILSANRKAGPGQAQGAPSRRTRGNREQKVIGLRLGAYTSGDISILLPLSVRFRVVEGDWQRALNR